MSDWTKIGEVGVDSGMCWIGDPCYVLPRSIAEGEGTSELRDAGFLDWPDMLAAVEAVTPTTKQLNYAKRHPGLAVVFSAGFGDGSYEVFARYADVPGWGRRIAEVKVVFIPEEPSDGEAT